MITLPVKLLRIRRGANPDDPNAVTVATYFNRGLGEAMYRRLVADEREGSALVTGALFIDEATEDTDLAFDKASDAIGKGVAVDVDALTTQRDEAKGALDAQPVELVKP